MLGSGSPDTMRAGDSSRPIYVVTPGFPVSLEMTCFFTSTRFSQILSGGAYFYTKYHNDHKLLFHLIDQHLKMFIN